MDSNVKVKQIMGKNPPKSILIGMVAKKISTIISESGKDFDQAFKQWKGATSEALDKYDWDAVKSELKEKCCGGKPKSSPQASLSKVAKVQTIAPDTKAVYVAPQAVRTKGEFEIKNTEQGMVLKRTPNTKSIAIKCKEGTVGVQIDEDTIGCKAIDDTKKK